MRILSNESLTSHHLTRDQARDFLRADMLNLNLKLYEKHNQIYKSKHSLHI